MQVLRDGNRLPQPAAEDFLNPLHRVEGSDGERRAFVMYKLEASSSKHNAHARTRGETLRCLRIGSGFRTVRELAEAADLNELWLEVAERGGILSHYYSPDGRDDVAEAILRLERAMGRSLEELPTGGL